MQITYPHNLGREEAYQRINSMLNEMKEQYKGDINASQAFWNSSKDMMDFWLEAQGIKITCQVYLTEKDVRIELKLPFLIKSLSGRLEKTLKGELERRLS